MGITDFLNKAKDGLIEDAPQDAKTIRIATEGATTVDINTLNDLQPSNFKTLTVTDYQKLKNSILELGFSFPIDMWTDSQGKRWVVDSHQRLKVLRKMRDEEGYIIPPLPADHTHAKNRKEARKKLLAAASKYGSISEEGLTDFLNETDFEIPVEEVMDFVTFPEIEYLSGKDEVEPAEPPLLKEHQILTCPSCQFKGKEKDFLVKASESN